MSAFIQVKRYEAAAAIALTLLLAVVIVRAATPDRSRIRSLSVEGLDIAPAAIAQGQEVIQERAWTAPDDVYVLGWSHEMGASGVGAELALLAPGDTRLFFASGGAPVVNPTFFQNGAAFRIQKGDSLKLRYRVMNTGAPGSTNGARALIYFVPVTGN